MKDIKTAIANVTGKKFWQSLTFLLAGITHRQKNHIKKKGNPRDLPLFFLGKQSDLSKNKITSILKKEIKPENYSLIKIDPWLHPSHRKKSSLHDHVRQQAVKDNGYRLMLFVYSIKLFFANNLRWIIFTIAVTIITILLFRADHHEYIDMAQFFARGAASLIAVTLLLRVLGAPIQKFLDYIFFDNKDHRYSLSTKEVRELIKKSYKNNRPFVTIIDHIELCDTELALSLLNSAMVFSQYGMIFLIIGNQRVINNLVTRGNINIERLSQSDKKEFYEEHYAFNYYFGAQIYDSPMRHTKAENETKKNSQRKKKTSLAMAISTKDTQDLLSKATSCYEISHREMTGLHHSIHFYQHLLEIEDSEILELICAFFIAYRYDRYFLKDILLNLIGIENQQIDSPDMDNTLLKTSAREKIKSILTRQSKIAIALTDLVNDMNIPIK